MPDPTPIRPDPRIPYEPATEALRLEVVIRSTGEILTSFPPLHLEAYFWRAYVALSQIALQHYLSLSSRSVQLADGRLAPHLKPPLV